MPGIQGYTPTVVGREKAGTSKTACNAAQIAAQYMIKYITSQII
ncbi:MAG TPA: hypothetical protein PKW17_12165 [Smithellaceae bacterium]|nr:hypothetical protein [Smithellaceae bacterium]